MGSCWKWHESSKHTQEEAVVKVAAPNWKLRKWGHEEARIKREDGCMWGSWERHHVFLPHDAKQ